jgi:RimJ/RimL family protein N-acetyltransferase
VSDDGSRAIFRGEKVWLRAYERDDIDAYLGAVNDKDVSYWAGLALPRSREGVAALFEKIAAEHGRDSAYFTVCPLGSDEFIGTTWLWNRDARGWGYPSIEFSIFIGDTARWGTGIGTDAVNATVDAGFSNWDVRRIWLTTAAHNERSRRCFAKAGFVEEGVLRQAERQRGRVQDVTVMAILRSEWEALERPKSWEYD